MSDSVEQPAEPVPQIVLGIVRVDENGTWLDPVAEEPS